MHPEARDPARADPFDVHRFRGLAVARAAPILVAPAVATVAAARS